MAVTPFVDQRLPVDVERNARGGPRFKTNVIPLASGHEWRNAEWARARGWWDIGYGIRHKKYYIEVVNFFYARRGRLVGFRFKDWTDFELDQVIAIGTEDDERTQFQVFKEYRSGVGETFAYYRLIEKIVPGTYTVYKNGGVMTQGAGSSQYQIDTDTGEITLGSPLAENDQLRITCEFDVPVRFDTDDLDIDAETWEAGAIHSIPVIELKSTKAFTPPDLSL